MQTPIRSLVFALLLFAGSPGLGQSPARLIRQDEVTRIEKILSADDMQGRQVFTPGIEKAAAFIIREFKSAGLKPLPGSKDFRQPFTLIKTKRIEIRANLDGREIDSNQLTVLSAAADLSISPADHYQKAFIKKGDDFTAAFFKFLETDQNFIILVDTVFSKRFARLSAFQMPQLEGSGNRIFILTNRDPDQYSIQIKQEISRQQLSNIAGILPGRSLKNEYVIFSAHYDHLGTGTADAAGDTVFNGANDDASGVAAVISLANYF
ncbi:MAG TPA: M28 family peptidase, partial [Puia sp.]